MMQEWVIYKHTSMKSKKSYIGLTKTSMDRRWVQHTSEARNGSNVHFHRAIRLYGEDNWEHMILADGIDTLEEAKALEMYFIKKYDTFENGYNSTEGGDGRTSVGPIIHTETIKWYHEDHGQRTCTPWELAQEFPELYIGVLVKIADKENNIKLCKGWHLFEEKDTVPEMFEESKKVVYHRSGMQDSLTQAEMVNKYDIPRPQVLKLFRGASKIVHGWSLTKYQENSKKRKVYEYTREGRLMNTYESATDCAECLGIDNKRVSAWLSPSRGKDYYEYNNNIYSYKEEFEDGK